MVYYLVPALVVPLLLVLLLPVVYYLVPALVYPLLELVLLLSVLPHPGGHLLVGLGVGQPTEYRDLHYM